MAPPSISNEEKKVFEKYSRYFCLKSVQYVVQSRTGKKLKESSKQIQTKSDWFYLAITDDPDVLLEINKKLGPGLPPIGSSFNVEISLKTVDDDSLVLENWSIEFLDQADNSLKSLNNVYHKLSCLLKSLMAYTKACPAHGLSRKQGADNFSIHYRLYTGYPEVHNLGSGFRQQNVGYVMTPMFVLALKVAFRTDLTISPKSSFQTDNFLIQSDYYKSHCNTKFQIYEEDEDQMNGVMNDEDIFQCEISDNIQSYNGNVDASSMNKSNGISDRKYFEPRKKIGAFALDSHDPELFADLYLPDLGFKHLLQNDKDNNPIVNYPQPTTNNHQVEPQRSKPPKPSLDLNYNSETELEDDFMMLGIKPSFVEVSKNDVGAFFRDCQSAPSLISFNNQPTLAEQVSQLSSQLSCYENRLNKFDDFIDSLQDMETIH